MPDAHDNWDAHWDRYAASASRNPAQLMRHAFIARLLARGSAGGAMRVFDIGSGQGDLLALLRPRFPKAEFLGADFSASGVAISKAKVPDATFIEADLFHPPAELGRFHDWATDAVCSEGLEHLDDPAAFLRAALPYLTAGARLIVTVPGGPMSEFDRHIGHRRHFTRKDIAGVLHAAGFIVGRVYRAGFPFFNLYRGTVIARGRRLAQDVGAADGAFSLTAMLAMAMFRLLFHFNLTDSPFGWQLVAVARKA